MRKRPTIAAADRLSRWQSSPLDSDLQFANSMIAKAMTKCSWDRNVSWALKFKAYVEQSFPGLAYSPAYMAKAVTSNRVALAFLASVARKQPRAKTCVDSAKRALNFLRALLGVQPLDSDTNVRLLARAVRHSFARTVRQSPAFPAVFARAVLMTWGSSHIWWKRMAALMIILALCTMARGAEIVSCRREGIAWVRPDGTQVRAPLFNPVVSAGSSTPALLKHLRGFLVLFPSRKNHQSTPTWVPVISAAVVVLLAKHVAWLDVARSPTPGCLFPARRSARLDGARVYLPALLPESHMSVDSFRIILRQSLVECCNLSTQQAKQYGTHSLRVGAMELLRSKGVPAEIRQQLGGWMSATSALGYLQLPVTAQFSILRRIFC